MHEKAPFNSNQIRALEIYQSNPQMHPYTCIHCEDEVLLPVVEGLYCLNCAYLQTWAINWTTCFDKMEEIVKNNKKPIELVDLGAQV